MQKLNIQPKKSLGQNFLRDENIARKIVAALKLEQGDSVVEVGPGTGILTKYLIESKVPVTAVEIDRNLIQHLKQLFGEQPNFLLHHGDALKFDFEKIGTGKNGLKIVGNLPYNITSPLLFKIFEQRKLFKIATFMIQKEVAQRVVANFGSKDFGILSVFSQYHAEVKKLFNVSRNVFFPMPDVTSAVVQWDFNKQAALEKNEYQLFFELVKKVFSQRRKMLRNSLKLVKNINMDCDQIRIYLEKRPEQLPVSEFIELTKILAASRTT